MVFEGIINMHQQTGGQFLRSHNFFFFTKFCILRSLIQVCC